MEKLIVVNSEIKCAVRRSTRAKRLNLKVDKDEVRISVPPGATFADAKAFVESKREWIIRHVEAWRSQNQKPQRLYQTGEYLPYQGQNFPLHIRNTPAGSSRIRIMFTPEGFWLEMPADIPGKEWPLIARAALVKWYRQQAERVFRGRLDYFAGKMGLTYQGLSIREQKTRWGSCSSKKNINLNWRLLLAPVPVLDYLVVHELAHLKQMNHSPAFWDLVEGYIPDYRIWRKWLKDNSGTLSID